MPPAGIDVRNILLCLWLGVLFGGGRSSHAQESLDETGNWQVTGKGAVEKGETPPPVEGASALRCTVEEAERGYVYFRLAPPSPDLTQFGKLRFRLYGGLKDSELHEVVIQDGERRYSKWRTESLAARSKETRWTEFVIFLDSPTEDKGTDLRNVQTITWRILVRGGGEGSRSFFLDGVRLEPAGPSSAPGAAEVVLEHKQYQAVFTRESLFELARIRAPSGETIPVSTAIRMIPLSSAPEDAATVTIGGMARWKKVEASPERLRVEYEQGDFSHENTFAWEGDALAIRRRVRCLRAGIGGHGSRLHVVSFGDPLNRCLFEHGTRDSTVALPVASRIELPGNWLAAVGENKNGAAVIFPRRVLYSYAVEGRQALISDRANFSRNNLPRGAELEYELWIAPLGPDSPGTQAREAARSICARLAEQRDPGLAYFAWPYQRQHPEGRTLVSREEFLLWESPPGMTVPMGAPPPTAYADRLTLSLARGETEPLHLAVFARKSMKNVSAMCPPLTGGGHTIPAEQFRVRYAGYVDIRPTSEAERAPLPEPEQAQFTGEISGGTTYLLTDRFYGAQARALGPVEDPLYDAPSVDVAAGQNQPIWIALSVPSDTPPGKYRGEVVLNADGRELCRVPLEVTVWSFTLPRVTSLRTWYQLWNSPQALPFWREYYRDLAEHKVSGFGSIPGATIENGTSVSTGPHVRLEDGKVVVDWSRFDEVASYLFDELGMRHAKLPQGKRGGGHVHVYDFLGLKENTPEFQTAFYDYLCEARRHLAEKGWLKNLDCYIFDEPDKERIEVIRRTAPIVRRAIPEMSIFAACARNTRSLVGILNAWCPPMEYFGLPYGEFSPTLVEEGRARGEVYLWYNQPDNCIGAPIITHRALPWATWKAGVGGYFVWSINYWGTKSFPWAVRYEIGEAMAIYPGRNGPVDSIRWEQTREGLEDYDYLVMLEKAIEKPDAPKATAERGRAALDRARRMFSDPRCLIGVNPRELSDVRREIGEILDGLSR